jgi:PAS domain S-box-containing protein
MDAQAEAQRLAALFEYEVLDTPPELAFDRLTALAADIFDAPIALISLIDSERQWFKSRIGLDASCTARDLAFCAHAIEGGPASTFVVEDATRDPRFAANPLVTGDPNIRFYAGATLTTSQGHNLGTLCVIDEKPRPTPSPKDLERLKRLAAIVVGEMEAARARRQGEATRLLLEMVEHISEVGHWRLDLRDGRLTWSDEAYRLHGVDKATFRPGYDNATAFFNPEDQALIAERVAHSRETGEGYDLQLKLNRPDGVVRDVIIKSRCSVEPDGQVTGLFGVILDITDQLRGQRTAERSRARYQLLADNMADAVTRIRLDGSSGYISPAIEQLIGWTPAEMVGRPAHAFVWPEDRPLILSAFAEMAAGLDDKTVQHRAQHKNGHAVWMETRFRTVRDASGQPVEMVAVIRDISDRKAAETALEESEARYRLLAEHATDVIARTDLRGRILYVTPSVEALLGYTAEQAMQSNVAIVVHPDDLVAFSAAYGDLLRGVRPAGQPIRYRLRRSDGAWVWVEGNPRLVRDGDGLPVEIVDVIRNVTEQVELEQALRLARDEADAAARAKSEFLANMSHELRTPLTAIIGFSGLLKVRNDLPPQAAMFAGRIEGASHALLATINDVLDFSKLEAGQVEIRPAPCDVAALVEEVAAVLEQQATAKGLTLETRLSGLPSRLQVDGDRVRQVLLNLMGNAVKFTAQGKVSVHAAFEEAGLIVEVADTGPGLSDAQQGLLFQRFSQVDSSASRSHGGTGLGLAICKGLVEAMGGAIGVSSRLGEGAVFRFVVPCEPALEPLGA